MRKRRPAAGGRRAAPLAVVQGMLDFLHSRYRVVGALAERRACFAEGTGMAVRRRANSADRSAWQCWWRVEGYGCSA
jgi:hypothetical protein